jgi:hypothetical protein
LKSFRSDEPVSPVPGNVGNAIADSVAKTVANAIVMRDCVGFNWRLLQV